MKILSITAQKPHSTGRGTYLTEVVKALAGLGHEQAVVAGIYEDDKAHFPDSVGFYPVFFSEDFPIVGMSDVMPYPSQLYSRMSEADVERFRMMFEPVIRKAAAELQPDIIFCHHLFLLTSIVREMFPDAVIYGLSHGSDLRQFRQSDNLRDIVRPRIAELDRVYALHAEQKNMIKELFGIEDDRIYIAGSGYNSAIFNRDLRGEMGVDEIPVRIAFAGKLSRAKGVLEFMEAGRILAGDPEFPEFVISLAGGCQDNEVLNAVKEQPFAEYVGMLNQIELSVMLQKCDVFVLPSYYEGLPLVLMEAMACGAVPVCTDLPGVKDWVEKSINGSTAVFVERPEMVSVDEPAEEAKPIFARNLAEAIKIAYRTQVCIKDGCIPEPDTEAVSWVACAERIFAH